MTDDELTAFIERIVDEKLRQRDRKMRAALSEGIERGVTTGLDMLREQRASLSRIQKEAKRQRRLHGPSA